MNQSSRKSEILRLKIGPVIERAEGILATIDSDLPEHQGLRRAAQGVVNAGREAQRASRLLSRRIGIHRVPALFLVASVCLLAGWLYWQFVHTARLRVAIPDRDAVQLHTRLRSRTARVKFEEVPTSGSREGVTLVDRGEVDIAFVQGGVPIPTDLPRLKTSSPEVVLYFVRAGSNEPSKPRRVLTSVRGQGSHSVALDVFAAWRIGDPPEFVHQWRSVAGEAGYDIPADIDGVFVVKDPSSDKTLRATRRLAAAGFELVSVELGSREVRLPYLTPTPLRPAYLQQDPAVPSKAINSYQVSTYIVARRGLTPRLLAAGRHLLDPQSARLEDQSFEPTVGDISEVFQGVEAFLGILIYMGLAFLALLGLEMMTYRRYFMELNSLISLISMHQSSKDVLGLSDKNVQRNNLLYLGLCSDLLGLISVITGYYAQENISLLYNNLLEVIHGRCDQLKINIQLKILHATVEIM